MSQTDTILAMNKRLKAGFLTGEAKWKDIKDLVDRWVKRNPEEYQDTLAYIAYRKSELKDKKFGTGESDSMRVGLAIPPTLMHYLESFHPTFMQDNSDVVEFGKRFKAFQIPEKL